MADNYITIRSRPRRGSGEDSTYGSSAGGDRTPSATHDISRVNYHIKDISDFAKTLENSAARAFPTRGRSQRYKKVQSLLLYWGKDDLFVLPELEDLEKCFREHYSFETDVFSIPSENSHLELMMRVGQMIKEHESDDTLFVIYYGGHARIDESRQSTWCANRETDSPWLQWSAIQTLLERSLSDVLILLDCCAGAASATFPNGNSITETISASSWDAIAPNPGRFSFTSVLIEVMEAWKFRTYSAAMLHAEILARLKHPRPEMLNGRHYEARSTPVHFMMTSNHRAPSIEMARVAFDDRISPSLAAEAGDDNSPAAEAGDDNPLGATGRSGMPQDVVGSEPNEDVPHVMISVALEGNQALDFNAWEKWLADFPAAAKYLKVQGAFKSHSTLLLLSLPVGIWNLLPENLACNFVGFIRSNNLVVQSTVAPRPDAVVETKPCAEEESRTLEYDPIRSVFVSEVGRRRTEPTLGYKKSIPSDRISKRSVANDFTSLSSKTLVESETRPKRQELAPHVQTRLEEYFQNNSDMPSQAVTEFLASQQGVETHHVNFWFAHRREQQEIHNKLSSLRLDDQRQDSSKNRIRMILAGHLNNLLEIVPLAQMLLVDLRSAADYDRSHIHGSINLRAPASFIEKSSIEMIEKSLADETSRETLKNFQNCECVVLYDRHIEYDWECPTAGALVHKFRIHGWQGQAFILKGHYREFSDSFDKYIAGQRMTGNAKKYLESLQERSLEKTKDYAHEYNEWLSLLESEDRVPPTDLAPAVKAERLGATASHQKDLEDEFERQKPSLYKKALERSTEKNWDRMGPMVEPLARGLEKMPAGRGPGGGNPSQPVYADKLLQDAYSARHRDQVKSDEDPRAGDGALKNRDAGSTPEQAGSGPDPKKKGLRNMLKISRSGR